MAKKVIPLSFKNTPDDLELYEWIMKNSSYSGFIKDILKKVMIEEKEKKSQLHQL